jgi:iron-regulated transporter 1
MLDQEQQERLLVPTGETVDQLQQTDENTATARSTTTDAEHSRIRLRLYTSHALSTWNSRLFEFGAFLFLAKIYPLTLLPASVYALARAAAAALISPWLGSYIDKADRLRAVRLSIGIQPLTLSVCTSLIHFKSVNACQ